VLLDHPEPKLAQSAAASNAASPEIPSPEIPSPKLQAGNGPQASPEAPSR
jgi:hypothetical protein